VILLLPFQKIEIRPIGFVKRSSSNEDIKDKSLVSRIVFQKKFTKALDGVEEFSHVFVIFWLHNILNTRKTVLKVHPHGRAELPFVGIFATRAPVRPNPVGLTLVELVKCEGNVLWVKGLDALNGTPVLDIKPYNSWDVAVNARVPRWLTKIDK